MSKTFITISRRECLLVYNKLLINARNHFQASELLANNKLYGVAVSHRILASEELVKGLILFFDGIGLNIRQVSGVKKFFSDHQIRHVLACGISATAIYLRHKIKKGQENTQLDTAKMAQQIQFWIGADDFKMEGFYVDYEDKVLTPQDVREIDYKNVFSITEDFKNDCDFIINYLESLSKTEIEVLLEVLEKQELYRIIRQMLQEYSQSKKPPLSQV